jgi:alpha-L-fucosidase 2
VEFKAKGEGVINGEVALDSKLHYTTSAADGVLAAEGYAPYYISFRTKEIAWDENRGVHFTVLVKPVEFDGTVECRDAKLVLKDCKRVVLLVASATSFNSYDKDPVKEGRDYKSIARQRLADAERFSFAELQRRHLDDYTRYFNRVDIEFDGEDKSNIPTDDRLKALSAGAEDRELEALYLHFSRYLIISASRTENVPMNLQAIWNESLLPPWNSNYTININTEANYWSTEVFNLSEFHQPLLSFLKQLAKSGEKTARDYYGCGGWCACHNSDLWAMTNPVGEGKGSPHWANWNMGGAWLATHLWEHYLYTQDREYLAEYAYPLLKGASQFLLDWVVEDKQTGYIVTSPSTSPENSFKDPLTGRKVATSVGATADIAIIEELLSATLSAAEILGIDTEFKTKMKVVLNQLLPYQIGRNGALQEWSRDFKEWDPKHRHTSHLIGLFPGNHISVERTPELAKAVERTLELRGNLSTGWAISWRIGLYARLLDGEKAYSIYRNLLNYTRELNPKVVAAGTVGGTYPNMLDSCPPFQIDGNLGAPACVTEMLMQSQYGSIDLLPALPKAWANGSFRGLRARGAFEVEAKWRGGSVVSGKIVSHMGEKCVLRTLAPIKIKGAEVEYSTDGRYFVATFATRKGGVYRF